MMNREFMWLWSLVPMSTGSTAESLPEVQVE